MEGSEVGRFVGSPPLGSFGILGTEIEEVGVGSGISEIVTPGAGVISSAAAGDTGDTTPRLAPATTVNTDSAQTLAATLTVLVAPESGLRTPSLNPPVIFDIHFFIEFPR